jgi:hypothetical protein
VNIVKSAEGILFSLAMLLVALLLLYGVSHFIIRFSPTPVSGWFSGIISRTTPSGWGD